MKEDEDKVSLAQAIKHIRENMVAQKESIILTAELNKYKFDAHIAQGFTPDQALRIIIGGRV